MSDDDPIGELGARVGDTLFPSGDVKEVRVHWKPILFLALAYAIINFIMIPEKSIAFYWYFLPSLISGVLSPNKKSVVVNSGLSGFVVTATSVYLFYILEYGNWNHPNEGIEMPLLFIPGLALVVAIIGVIIGLVAHPFHGLIDDKLDLPLRRQIGITLRWINLSIALVLGAILVFGILTLVGGNISLVNQISTSSWPTTEAEITSTENVRDGQIEYRYVVDDEIYVSDRVVFFHHESFCERCDPKEELATRIAKKYPVGSTILIHYDPEIPERAVLRTDDWQFELVIDLAFIILLVVVLRFADSFRRVARSK
jgi:hypothetical protein